MVLLEECAPKEDVYLQEFASDMIESEYDKEVSKAEKSIISLLDKGKTEFSPKQKKALLALAKNVFECYPIEAYALRKLARAK